MFEVKLHKKVSKFLKELDEKKARQCKEAVNELASNPFVNRSKCDLKKLSGKKKVYRLRVRDIRFIYVIDKEDSTVYIQKAFKREKGYR